MVLGMFDFVWELLYQLSKLFLRIIDLVTTCCNKIGGIDTVSIDGNDTTLFEYLFTSKSVYIAFAVAAICGVVFTFFFAIIQIIINYSKDKTEETPVSIVKKAAKNIFIAMCVPAVMLVFFILGNALVKAMYQATSIGSSSLSQYLFAVFSQEGAKMDAVEAAGYDRISMYNGLVSWDDPLDHIKKYINLSDFDFFYSYLIGGIVMWALFSTALMLVERVLSLVLLFIVSPLVISSSMMDDGVRFKNWRDQVLIKFFTGFGAMVGINIYMLIVKMTTSDQIRFFDSGILNQFMKLLFIVGGAVCMKQTQALVGNIISQGAGDKSIAENERSNGALTSGSFLGAFKAPFKAVRGVTNWGKDVSKYGLGSVVARDFGFKTQYDYARDFGLRNGARQAAEGGSGNYNGNVPNMEGNNIINANINRNSDNQNRTNANDNQPKNNARAGQNMVNGVLANAASLNNKDK